MRTKLSQFSFDYAEKQVASYPAPNRDDSRLMVIDRKTGKIEHKVFKDLIEYFDEGDIMLYNNTKVFPARLYGRKEKTGAKIEVFLLRELNHDTRLWDVLVDPARKIRVGNKLYFSDDEDNDILIAEVVDNTARYLERHQGNVQLSVSHTVSAYNIYYLDEFFTWCEHMGLPEPWLGRVHNPAHMRPSVWHNTARRAIIDKLSQSQYQDVQVWKEMIANSDDSKLFESFKTYQKQHDQYRGTDFATAFPELAKYLTDKIK
jgi:S-adenosylmethionine:tRNA-ribosyltransferase-isomerase (queuine synthetase)